MKQNQQKFHQEATLNDIKLNSKKEVILSNNGDSEIDMLYLDMFIEIIIV